MPIEIPRIYNWIGGEEIPPDNDLWLEKRNPHNGQLLSYFANSTGIDTKRAVSHAEKAFPAWSHLTPVKRGQILSSIVSEMKKCSEELAECVALETGKPPNDAIGEVLGAILQGEYFAGEGMRLYGRGLTSGIPNKHTYTVRQPHGIAGLIVPANTPIANIAWKTFPALICGNTVVLKASEDSPRIALLFAQIAKEAGLPAGVFNIVHGLGRPAGATLVEDPRIALISFTGSTKVGRWIAEIAGKRLARVSLELGGKNPFVVCDDADIEHAVKWAILSAFSNAGQRCSSGSRFLVFKNVYDSFRDRLVDKTQSLKLGVGEDCDLGPVINSLQQENILAAIEKARSEGGNVLCGGSASSKPELAGGYYVNPTIIEGLSPSAEINIKEIFGPVITLHPVTDLAEAIESSNFSEYGLTAAIHTRSVDRAMVFAMSVRAGVANINLGTYGSEPHMPFGGVGSSGNGTREPGIEALDVYSELKNISILSRNNLI